MPITRALGKSYENDHYKSPTSNLPPLTLILHIIPHFTGTLRILIMQPHHLFPFSYLLLLMNIDIRLKGICGYSINTTLVSLGREDKSLDKNWSEPIFDKNTFERMKETLKMEHKVNDVVLAMINSSAILQCRPDKDILSSNEQSNIHVRRLI
nr:hypothetical transcript [Hymenolepis microstoma]